VYDDILRFLDRETSQRRWTHMADVARKGRDSLCL
jgi:hypothetical protein